MKKFRMSEYPTGPKEMTKGMMYFPRMLDKIRRHGRGELPEEYHGNLGAPKTADGACTNFLRVNYGVLRQRVLKGGTDEEILDWCYTNGRRLNEGDLVVWNGFVSKLGWIATRNQTGPCRDGFSRCFATGKSSRVPPVSAKTSRTRCEFRALSS